MNDRERLSNFFSRLRPKVEGNPFVPADDDYHFAMAVNGFFHTEERNWGFQKGKIGKLAGEFVGQQVSFFGPGSKDEFFSGSSAATFSKVGQTFSQRSVIDAVGKYRRLDEHMARRVAFILGGIVRHYVAIGNPEVVDRYVDFIAGMTLLGGPKSGDAIASAMAMYVMSGGSLQEDRSFKQNVALMSHAIEEDTVVPKSTVDLGLSQVLRLRRFRELLQGDEISEPPNVSVFLNSFRDFPTTGAEFHMSPKDIHPTLLKRLAILNMSQYQAGSYVQFSRNDRGVLEVRMNPSIYPITVANWNNIRLLIPELNRTFYHLTFNRRNDNFDWIGDNKVLLERLRGLGRLCYANIYSELPEAPNDELNFGNVYLGQTVRNKDGQYDFSGLWTGGSTGHGQLSVYTGVGKVFGEGAYYLSMALAKPDILEGVKKDLKDLKMEDAVTMDPNKIEQVFSHVEDAIAHETILMDARHAGGWIIDHLSP